MKNEEALKHLKEAIGSEANVDKMGELAKSAVGNAQVCNIGFMLQDFVEFMEEASLLEEGFQNLHRPKSDEVEEARAALRGDVIEALVVGCGCGKK